MSHLNRSRARALAAVLGAAALGSFASPAPASAACDPPSSLTKAFLAFGDLADYSLIPNGGLESGSTGWSLRRAEVLDGNESFFLNSVSDTRALWIHPGGRAISPPFCVGAEHPTFRFVVRQPGGEGTPDLGVYVRYVESSGQLKDQKLVTLAGSDHRHWRPSPVFDLYSKLGLSDPDATTTAHVMVAAEDEDGAAWRVDDVFVDPYKRR